MSETSMIDEEDIRIYPREDLRIFQAFLDKCVEDTDMSPEECTKTVVSFVGAEDVRSFRMLEMSFMTILHQSTEPADPSRPTKKKRSDHITGKLTPFGAEEMLRLRDEGRLKR
jgi:hypothetical protein